MNTLLTTELNSTFDFIKNNAFSQTFGDETFYKYFNALKEKARNKKMTAPDMVLYNIIRGHEATRGFTPITNKVKLSNGMSPLAGYEQAAWALKYMIKNNKVELVKDEKDFLLKVLG